ncbi:J domain-containing protein [Microbacterium sp. No. 7]|uniref:J domain-containing protein n=1 Tax=Microbacterium sp. No. 7 TaxID=1714373 RepID=UPI0006D187E1|nr:J domain-containing protein [Microbacterium sp. No. 7]ALJ21717.1 molecular chaperone DnaJ [Microbacterium sp. No. 7]
MFDSPLSDSAYDVLGVAPDVDDEALRRAYRLRLRQTHPDTGGDAAVFVRVQRAWELVGTPEARTAYDRGHGFGSAPSHEPRAWSPPRADTRPKARSFGQPGGSKRERYLGLMREWAGRGVALDDPYDPALVRSAPREIKRLLAEALAEEETARTVSALGMGYTVWHEVVARDPAAPVDHIVLGPSGLYAVASDDLGGPVRTRRGEIVGDGLAGAPVATLVARARGIGRAAGVRFSGAIVVLPDEDVAASIDELGRVKGLPVAVVSRSALATVLRRGLTGARAIGGNELFDVRTRLQQALRFV